MRASASVIPLNMVLARFVEPAPQPLRRELLAVPTIVLCEDSEHRSATTEGTSQKGVECDCHF